MGNARDSLRIRWKTLLMVVLSIGALGSGRCGNSNPNGTIEEAPETIPIGQVAEFEGKGEDPGDKDLPLAYRWDFGGSGIPQNGLTGKNAKVIFCEEGTVPVTFTVADASEPPCVDLSPDTTQLRVGAWEFKPWGKNAGKTEKGAIDAERLVRHIDGQNLKGRAYTLDCKFNTPPDGTGRRMRIAVYKNSYGCDPAEDPCEYWVCGQEVPTGGRNRYIRAEFLQDNGQWTPMKHFAKGKHEDGEVYHWYSPIEEKLEACLHRADCVRGGCDAGDDYPAIGDNCPSVQDPCHKDAG